MLQFPYKPFTHTLDSVLNNQNYLKSTNNYRLSSDTIAHVETDEAGVVDPCAFSQGFNEHDMGSKKETAAFKRLFKQLHKPTSTYHIGRSSAHKRISK